MKPLLVANSAEGGGAAKAGHRLYRALRGSGIDARMLVRSKGTDPNILGPRTAFAEAMASLRPRAEVRLQRLQRITNQEWHSANVLPSRWSRIIDASDVDVVNLHWIGLGAMSVEDVGRITKPLVMTLHDMWAFCGAEHYAPEDDSARWRVGYFRSNRPNEHRGIDLDRWTWRRKSRHWRPIPVVCPSRWLAECARQSALMGEWPIHVIPHALDLDTFHPVNKQYARGVLDLPHDAHVVLFGADAAGGDGRKGYDLLLEGLGRLRDGTERMLGVIFGHADPKDPPRIGIQLRQQGRINDDTTLALLYSAADVMVVPSRQEALGQTGTEAQACGTPVVGFSSTGLADVVSHRETGYLAEAFSSIDLARGISWVLEDEGRRASLRLQARNRATRLWDPEVIAAQYLAIYEQAMVNSRPLPPKGR